MLLLDLKPLLFVVLLALLGTAGAAVWLDRRRRARAGGLRAGLERAPFGALALVNGRYRANAAARRLLRLPAPAGPLPETAWADQLRADREAAHGGDHATGGGTDKAGRARTLAVGDRWVRWWVMPGADEDLVFALDVTAEQRAEQRTRFLISDLSHELRTPLASVLTHAEVLDGPADAETSARSVRLLKAEAERMSRLVARLLELGRLETAGELERRPVDVIALAEQAIAQLGPTAQAHEIDLTLEADPTLPPALGDADRLRQVLVNLLDNAVRYSSPGDRVTVRLTRDPDRIQVAVEDSGPGIPAEHLPRVTERFYRGTAGNAGEPGSGLGLALVAEILRHHDSRLEIESPALPCELASKSEPETEGDGESEDLEGDGRGTRARFTLPIAPPALDR